MGEKTFYNIVDSVKGGCGKSTFSIMLALALDDKRRADEKGTEDEKGNQLKTEIPNVCLVDMDLQGTAMGYLLFGKNIEAEGIKEVAGADIYLNEKATNDDRPQDKYVSRVSWKDDSSQSHTFDVVLSSPKQADKNRYKMVSRQNYSPEVLYSTFRKGLANMLKRDQLFASSSREYKYVIFDMPPNSDGYSDAVFDCILDVKHRAIRREDECNLFIVQTLDMGHRYATKDYFVDLITRNQNNEGATRIFFVFNNIFVFDVNAYEMHFKNAIAEIKDMLNNMKMTQIGTSQIFFVGIRFNKDYYKMCSTRDGIKNEQLPSDALKPVLFLEDINGPIGNNHTLDLIKIMEGGAVK